MPPRTRIPRPILLARESLHQTLNDALAALRAAANEQGEVLRPHYQVVMEAFPGASQTQASQIVSRLGYLGLRGRKKVDTTTQVTPVMAEQAWQNMVSKQEQQRINQQALLSDETAPEPGKDATPEELRAWVVVLTRRNKALFDKVHELTKLLSQAQEALAEAKANRLTMTPALWGIVDRYRQLPSDSS